MKQNKIVFINNFHLFRENRDEYIQNTMRDNMQLLVNALWQVPIERHDNSIVAKLPDAKTVVPREKPVSFNFS